MNSLVKDVTDEKAPLPTLHSLAGQARPHGWAVISERDTAGEMEAKAKARPQCGLPGTPPGQSWAPHHATSSMRHHSTIWAGSSLFAAMALAMEAYLAMALQSGHRQPGRCFSCRTVAKSTRVLPRLGRGLLWSRFIMGMIDVFEMGELLYIFGVKMSSFQA